MSPLHFALQMLLNLHFKFVTRYLIKEKKENKDRLRVGDGVMFAFRRPCFPSVSTGAFLPFDNLFSDKCRHDTVGRINGVSMGCLAGAGYMKIKGNFCLCSNIDTNKELIKPSTDNFVALNIIMSTFAHVKKIS